MRTIFTVLAGLAISVFIVSCGSGGGDGSVSNLSGSNAPAEAELATVEAAGKTPKKKTVIKTKAIKKLPGKKKAKRPRK